MATSEDKIKQEEMKTFYSNSSYYEDNKHNFADVSSKSKHYLINNVLSIYYPEKEEKIIVLGAGWGNISLALQKRGFNVISLDYSQQSIDICKRTAVKLDMDSSGFICRDATDTQFDDAFFDVAYCADLVEHLYPSVYNDLVKETRRILKKGGKFAIYTPNPSHFFEILKKHNIVLRKDISHVDYKTMPRLKESLSNQGFMIKKAFYIESHIPFLDVLERNLMKFVPFFRRRNAVLAIKS
ncbi:MAG: hypothetical protein DRI57_23425 [Deltaproteobacteria bacterium]|nr:MAG: hypothetical protein DRI57_23425 [Deltaproteobacteria bacterium]